MFGVDPKICDLLMDLQLYYAHGKLWVSNVWETDDYFFLNFVGVQSLP